VYAPSSELAPPTPPPLKVSVSPPLDPKGGSNTLLQVRGGVPNSDDWIEGLALSILSALVVELREKSPSRGRPEFGRLFLFKGAS
jgi:hypothetical protein